MGCVRTSLVFLLCIGYIMSFVAEEVLGAINLEEREDNYDDLELSARKSESSKRYLDGLVKNDVMRRLEILK